ncbi:SpoIIE family protein phosphatase [Streptomyces sp. NPDC048361]|uniref:PP2C family protein-serine/threonine phosphatase n=1 Tax=Streptomyces sp. NPDC048361 TaxID=3154720 RepID=UPI0034486AC0
MQYRGLRHAGSARNPLDCASHAVDAGSPQLFRLRHGTVEQIRLDAQLPLGMFEETEYHADQFSLDPGDRLVIVSSGVHAAQRAGSSVFGERGLRETIAATRSASAHETARAVVDGLVQYHGGGDLPTDAAVVCLDWRGSPSLGGTRA